MAAVAKATRIEPAFDDPRSVLEMFQRHAPYRTMAGYLPIKSMGEACQPWFRGNWADKGEPLVDGAEGFCAIDASSRPRARSWAARPCGLRCWW
jgi:hypothetical protein